jgi:acetyl esterase/lipase
VALDWEGYDIARWLSGIGITGIVLKYRMPQPDISLDITRDDKPLPLVDAQRALRMVRANAAQWHIDPTKVGIAGFSAGGHLASMAGTHFDKPDPQASGPLQRESDRPDFMILVYPITSLTDPLGHDARLKLLGTTPDEKMVYLYSNEKHVTENTPPTFLAHAEDDVVKCEHSTYFFEALRAHKVPCELMLFARGGHGFGLGQKGGEPAAWPKECEAWLMKQHVLTGTPTSAPASSKHQ